MSHTQTLLLALLLLLNSIGALGQHQIVPLWPDYRLKYDGVIERPRTRANLMNAAKSAGVKTVQVWMVHPQFGDSLLLQSMQFNQQGFPVTESFFLSERGFFSALEDRDCIGVDGFEDPNQYAYCAQQRKQDIANATVHYQYKYSKRGSLTRIRCAGLHDFYRGKKMRVHLKQRQVSDTLRLLHCAIRLRPADRFRKKTAHFPNAVLTERLQRPNVWKLTLDYHNDRHAILKRSVQQPNAVTDFSSLDADWYNGPHKYDPAKGPQTLPPDHKYWHWLKKIPGVPDSVYYAAAQTHFGYDSLGRLISTFMIGADGLQASSIYQYNEQSLPNKRTFLMDFHAFKRYAGTVHYRYVYTFHAEPDTTGDAAIEAENSWILYSLGY